MRNKCRVVACAAALLLMVLCCALPAVAAVTDFLFPLTMATHYVPLTSIPTSTTVAYATSVWLKSVEFVPQSTSSPTCTITDGNNVLIYNAVTLTPNGSYRDTRPDTAPLFASGGIKWSCSDTTVKAQLIVMY